MKMQINFKNMAELYVILDMNRNCCLINLTDMKGRVIYIVITVPKPFTIMEDSIIAVSAWKISVSSVLKKGVE